VVVCLNGRGAAVPEEPKKNQMNEDRMPHVVDNFGEWNLI